MHTKQLLINQAKRSGLGFLSQIEPAILIRLIAEKKVNRALPKCFSWLYFADKKCKPCLVKYYCCNAQKGDLHTENDIDVTLTESFVEANSNSGFKEGSRMFRLLGKVRRGTFTKQELINYSYIMFKKSVLDIDYFLTHLGTVKLLRRVGKAKFRIIRYD